MTVRILLVNHSTEPDERQSLAVRVSVTVLASVALLCAEVARSLSLLDA